MARSALMMWRRRVARLTTVVAGMLSLGAIASPPSSGKDGGPTGSIYSCVDPSGRRLSSDRPIPECLNQEQRLLGRDGTLRKTVPPLMSPEQQAQQEAERKAQAQMQAVHNEVVRRDRLLMDRYPSLATHDAARKRALEPVQKAIDATRLRISRLEAERLALTNERAALGFKPVPEDLKLRTSGNDGSLEAQRTILRDQEAERDRVNLQFDGERQRLQQLLAGMPAGAPVQDAAASPALKKMP